MRIKKPRESQNINAFLDEVTKSAKERDLPANKVYGRVEDDLKPRGVLKAVGMVRSLIRTQIEETMLDGTQMDFIEDCLNEAVVVKERNSNVDPEHFELGGIRKEIVLTIAAYLNSLG